MSYGGNSGSGGGSIHASTDVALSNPADGQVLTYSGSLAKWQNAAGAHGVFVNVKDYGAVGDGSTDDAAAIQAAVNAASYGGTVFFPKASVNYIVGSTITIPNGVRLLGSHSTAFTPNTAPYSSQMYGCIIKMKNGANLDAVIASAGWYNASGSINLNFEMDHLLIDGNAANQTAGLGIGVALSHWRSRVVDCVIFNTAGDGILLTNEARVSGQASEYIASQSSATYNLYNQAGNGVTLGQGTYLAGSIVECYFERNILAYNGVANGASTPSPGANGFHIWENPAHRGYVTDGVFRENLIQNPGFDGVHIWQGGDWIINDNHPYACGYSDIWMTYTTGSSICNNFCESPGNKATNTSVYNISVAGNGGTANRIDGNRLALVTTAPTSGNTFYGIRANNAYTTANNWAFTITNNVFWGGSSSAPYGTAVQLYNSAASGVAYQGSAIIANNAIGPNWATQQVSAGTGSWVVAAQMTIDALVVSGAAAVGTNVLPPGSRVARGLTITEAHIIAGTAPAGSALTVTVSRSGSVLLTLTLAAGAGNADQTGLSVALSAGDILTYNITAIGSSGPGSDIAVQLVGN